MASRALMARFMSTCSIWPASARTLPSAAPATVTIWMFALIRRRSIFSTSATTVVEVEHVGLEDLAAAEGEQLAGEGGRPVRRPA